MIKKVLIVDDNDDDAKTMRDLLEKEGYEVTTENTRALELLKENGFDMILIDIHMPVLSGYDLVRILREKVKKNVKLVYVSVTPEKEVSLEGADGFIQKPFTPEDFIQKVKRLIG